MVVRRFGWAAAAVCRCDAGAVCGGTDAPSAVTGAAAAMGTLFRWELWDEGFLRCLLVDSDLYAVGSAVRWSEESRWNGAGWAPLDSTSRRAKLSNTA
jgi:hypothetical protein